MVDTVASVISSMYGLSSGKSSRVSRVGDSRSRISIRSTTSKRKAVPDQKCYKHSPRVKPRPTEPTIEKHDYEALQWTITFNTMGRLQQLGLKEVIPFTTLNKEPYHCGSLSRDFKVAYGPISQVEGGTVKGIVKPKKEVKISYCNCVGLSFLPRITEYSKLDIVSSNVLNQTSKPGPGPYLPRSCIEVRWDDKIYNMELICEWLLNFGPLVFSIRKDLHSAIVAFESIQASYNAVNQDVKGVLISWYDPKFYNYGYYRLFENYTISKDKNWHKGLAQVLRRFRPELGTATGNLRKRSTPKGKKSIHFRWDES